MKAPKLTIRVDLGDGRALGPGKIRLLEAIGKTGSISEAARKLNISYHRAWEMVDDMKGCFRALVIKPRRGGAHGDPLHRSEQLWSNCTAGLRVTLRQRSASISTNLKRH
jgi:molybdate transport system regulatory protein